MFECGNRLLSRHRGEIVEEVRQGMATFDVVDQSLDRHTRSDEDGCPSEDLGIALNDLLDVLHVEMIARSMRYGPGETQSIFYVTDSRI